MKKNKLTEFNEAVLVVLKNKKHQDFSPVLVKLFCCVSHWYGKFYRQIFHIDKIPFLTTYLHQCGWQNYLDFSTRIVVKIAEESHQYLASNLWSSGQNTCPLLQRPQKCLLPYVPYHSLYTYTFFILLAISVFAFTTNADHDRPAPSVQSGHISALFSSRPVFFNYYHI